MSLAFWTPGPLELGIIGLVAVLIFAKKLPSMARTLGQTIVEWRKSMKEIKGGRKE